MAAAAKGYSNNSPRQDAAAGWIREFEQLRTIRYNWESYWADCGRHILPNQNVFMRTLLYGTPQADRRTEFIFDSTATLALDRFAAAMESMLFPRTQRWAKYVPLNPQLLESRTVRSYLEEINEITFAARYSPRANFASQAHEGMLGLGAFGTAGLFIDEDVGASLRYRQINLQDLYIAEDHSGLIRTVYRQFLLSAVNAVEQFGAENLPEAIVAGANNPAQSQREFGFLHGVRPRKDAAYGRKDSKGMAFESCYLSLDYKSMIEEGGYRVMPYAVSRYTVGPREVYGRSPGMTSLADIKMLSEMSKTDIEASHMAVRPPLLVPDDDQRGWNLRPGALNYGGMMLVGDKMMPAVMPLNSGVRVDIAEEKMEGRRKIINDAFLVTLFQILTESPDMTATEALLRAQEKGALLTPTMGRQQSEFLGPLIQREIDILAHAGQFPPMPEELLMEGGAIKIEYSSPLNRLQRAEEGVGIMQTFQQLATFVEATQDTSVFDIFDPAAVARELAEVNGVPAKVLRDEDEVKQIQQQKAQAQQNQALMNAAPQAASAAKDLMSARETALNTPGPQPGVGGAPA